MKDPGAPVVGHVKHARCNPIVQQKSRLTEEPGRKLNAHESHEGKTPRTRIVRENSNGVKLKPHLTSSFNWSRVLSETAVKRFDAAPASVRPIWYAAANEAVVFKAWAGIWANMDKQEKRSKRERANKKEPQGSAKHCRTLLAALPPTDVKD